MLEVIEQVRTGSHQEFIATDDKGHGYHNTVTDFETVYHDCLVSKAWLKKHEHDEYPEATIDISIDGKTLSVNGDYKHGMIKDFIKANRP